MVGLRLRPIVAEEESICTPPLVVDICWAAVTDNDRIEHIFTGTSWDLINLVFFVRCDSFEEAKCKVLGLWQRASQGSPVLRGRFEVEVGSLEWT